MRRSVGLLQPPLFIDEKEMVHVQEDVSFSTRPGINLIELCTNAREYPTVFTKAAVELQLVYPHNQLMHVIKDVAMLSVVLALQSKDLRLGSYHCIICSLFTLVLFLGSFKSLRLAFDDSQNTVFSFHKSS